MLSNPENELLLDDAGLADLVTLPPEVLAAIDEVLPSSDPLDRHDFDLIEYINQLFPNEQSLSNIDDVMASMTERVRLADTDIRNAIRGHTTAGDDGRRALEEAQKSIVQLFNQITEIKNRAEQSERTVKEITRDIKQLDQGKRNLTAAVTTLNHLHMLTSGVDTLQSLISRRLYKEIASPLEGVMRVLENFDQYIDLPQIKHLSDQVHTFRADLAEQIMADFKDAFGSKAGRKPIPLQQLGHACLVVNVLEPKVKCDLLRWFVELQLVEYRHLFGSNESSAWLDCVERRYDWLKKHLIKFEEGLGPMFPPEWEISERIAVEFCIITRSELSSIMSRRVSEIDVKLLLFAIQKTSQFESLLSRRFTGITITEHQQQQRTAAHPADRTSHPAHVTSPTAQSTNPFGEPDPDPSDVTNPFLRTDSTDPVVPSVPVVTDPFQGIISRCFEQHLNIYIDSQDRNLTDLMERFSSDLKSRGFPTAATSGGDGSAPILPSCADLFMFYKKCLVQCSQLTRGRQMLALAAVFQKHLREYALKILLANLPKQTFGSSGGALIGKSSLPDLKDFSNLSNLSNLRDMATAGILQNFHSLLKEGDMPRLSRDDLRRVCSILTTSEYCLETTQQLGHKIKEKVEPALVNKIQLSNEEAVFHSVMSSCVQVLVQDLESACDPALSAMVKMSWQSVESVGDQSGYVSMATAQLKQVVPLIRDSLSGSRKYFTEVCIKFANTFIPKFILSLYKCKPVSTVGAEQLLLDAHSLKTALLGLPSVGSQTHRSAPTSYTKIVAKGMTRAEMILKVVMSPHGKSADFVGQYIRLLPDSELTEFQKVLEMKGIRRAEQNQLLEVFRSERPGGNLGTGGSSTGSPDHEASRIHRLEKLIKRRM